MDPILENAYKKYGISKQEASKAEEFLKDLKENNHGLYEHSRRVSITAARIAEFVRLSPKPAFYFGLIHHLDRTMDGKTLLADHIQKFNLKDRQNTSINAYDILKLFYDSAMEHPIKGHDYSRANYFNNLPNLSTYDSVKQLLGVYSRIVGLADYYDEKSRIIKDSKNDSQKNSQKNPRKSLKDVLLSGNMDQKELITELFDKGILK